MTYQNNTVRIEEQEDGAATQAFRDNSADVIHHHFPNLSNLEKYTLMSLIEPEHIERLLNKECSEQFNKTQITEAVQQYVGYLMHREKWEQRNLDPKTQPIWFRRGREPK